METSTQDILMVRQILIMEIIILITWANNILMAAVIDLHLTMFVAMKNNI